MSFYSVIWTSDTKRSPDLLSIKMDLTLLRVQRWQKPAVNTPPSPPTPSRGGGGSQNLSSPVPLPRNKVPPELAAWRFPLERKSLPFSPPSTIYRPRADWRLSFLIEPANLH